MNNPNELFFLEIFLSLENGILFFSFLLLFFSNENSNRIQFIKHFDHFEMLDWIIIITKIIIILIAYSIIEFDVESLEREREKFEIRILFLKNPIFFFRLKHSRPSRTFRHLDRTAQKKCWCSRKRNLCWIFMNRLESQKKKFPPTPRFD